MVRDNTCLEVAALAAVRVTTVVGGTLSLPALSLKVGVAIGPGLGGIERLLLLFVVEVSLLLVLVEATMLVNDTFEGTRFATVHLDVVDMLLVDRADEHVLVSCVLLISLATIVSLLLPHISSRVLEALLPHELLLRGQVSRGMVLLPSGPRPLIHW